ncbi:flagellar hook-associated protein FlgK [bacterium]|nr:flagellar hook-associated protein FlgK [bacterium]
MSIQKVFDQGRSGLATNQKGLSVTSHNISNVNTDGYSRQRVDVENIDPTDLGAGRVGGGARVRSIARSHSDFVSRRLEKEGTDLHRARATTGIYSQIENIFTNDSEQGLSKTMSGFFNEVRSLSTDPTSMPMRSAVVESANNVARDFNRLNKALDDVRVDLDNRVEGTVMRVNGLTQRIADLNQRIMGIEGSQGVANDERDRRDLALRELSGLVDIQVSTIENGGVNVASGRIGTLVSGIDNTEIAALRTQTEDFPDAMMVGVKTASNGVRDVSEYVKGGELGAYLNTRDEFLAGLKSDVNQMAGTFASNVNQVNASGFDGRGDKGGGIFDFDTGAVGAGTIKVSDELRLNPNLLAGAMKQGAAGDNSVLLQMADLESKAIVGGEKTLLDFNSEIVGRVGIETRSANEALETQEGIYAQLENLREEESGVSLDEEAMNMIKYQKAFDASAKVIQVADSMLETVLNLKRF